MEPSLSDVLNFGDILEKKIIFKIYFLFVYISIYMIQHERNNSLFKTKQSIIKNIISNIQLVDTYKLQNWKIKDTQSHRIQNFSKDFAMWYILIKLFWLSFIDFNFSLFIGGPLVSLSWRITGLCSSWTRICQHVALYRDFSGPGTRTTKDHYITNIVVNLMDIIWISLENDLVGLLSVNFCIFQLFQ